MNFLGKGGGGMAKHERRAVFFLLLTGGKSSQTTTTTRHKGQETVFGKKEEKMFFVSPFKKGAVFLERRRLMWACFRRGAKSKAGEKLEVGERQRIRAVNLLTHSWSRRSNTLNVYALPDKIFSSLRSLGRGHFKGE